MTASIQIDVTTVAKNVDINEQGPSKYRFTSLPKTTQFFSAAEN